MNVRRAWGPALLAALAVLLVSPAPAQAVDFGVRGGYYTDASEPFLGVEILTRVANRVYFNPNLEYVFVDEADYLTVNGDFHYDFHTRGNTYVWAGAGLAVIAFDPDGPAEGDSDLGLNLLAGVGFRSGSVVPYVQAKLIVEDETEFVVAFGVRF